MFGRLTANLLRTKFTQQYMFSTTISNDKVQRSNKTMKETLDTLYTLQSNEQSLLEWQRTRLTDKSTTSIEPMRTFLDRIKKLPVIHVAGTKGKGSTCAFAERVLRECGLKTGLNTSPHLIHETERFRINGESVSDEMFVDHFWHCYDRLQSAQTPELGMPAWFRMITLLALHIFVEQRVDVAVVEVGIGGRADATNCVYPTVCGVASLGYDHQNVLGDTIEEIAAEKAGIFKPGVPAFSYAQIPAAADVLRSVAQSARAPYALVELRDETRDLQLGVSGEHQWRNAALACALAGTFLQRTGRQHLLDVDDRNNMAPGLADVAQFTALCAAAPLAPLGAPLDVRVTRDALPATFARALERCRWPGRTQLIDDSASNVRYALDGAHTIESVDAATRWFVHASRADAVRVLLFACGTARRPAPLLRQMLTTAAELGDTRQFDLAVFSTFRVDATNGLNHERGEVPWRDDVTHDDRARGLPSLEWQRRTANAWLSAQRGAPVDADAHWRDDGSVPSDRVRCVPAARDAVGAVREFARTQSKPVDVFVTGSLLLVGAMLRALEANVRAL